MTDVNIVRSWKAKLELGYQYFDQKTRLMSNRHSGPLRVLKPFFPERDGTSHTYLLHPPGGLVIGDHLSIDIELATQSQVLVTAPSAGKIYNAAGSMAQQCQSVSITCHAGAVCEWLPHETIVFSGANAKLRMDVELYEGAHYFGWDVICLGRPAASETFEQGSVESIFNLKLDSTLILRDRFYLDGGSEQLRSQIGFQSSPIYGQLFFTGDYSNQISAWRDQLCLPTSDSTLFEISQIRPELCSARYLGCSAEQAKNLFYQVWERVRPIQQNKSVTQPRIWNT